MKAASDNAGDLISGLQLVYNKARQAGDPLRKFRRLSAAPRPYKIFSPLPSSSGARGDELDWIGCSATTQ